MQGKLYSSQPEFVILLAKQKVIILYRLPVSQYFTALD